LVTFGGCSGAKTSSRPGDRYQILPAYTILLYPAKNSVIVMDNVSIHHSENIRQLCADAGVILVYLPPYFPDYNDRRVPLRSEGIRKRVLEAVSRHDGQEPPGVQEILGFLRVRSELTK